MGDEAKRLLDDALRVDPSTRALIAETLLESLDLNDDVVVSGAWRTEIMRRCGELDTGAVTPIDGDAVMHLRREPGDWKDRC